MSNTENHDQRNDQLDDQLDDELDEELDSDCILSKKEIDKAIENIGSNDSDSPIAPLNDFLKKAMETMKPTIDKVFTKSTMSDLEGLSASFSTFNYEDMIMKVMLNSFNKMNINESDDGTYSEMKEASNNLLNLINSGVEKDSIEYKNALNKLNYINLKIAKNGYETKLKEINTTIDKINNGEIISFIETMKIINPKS
jgi:hypothetical protein